MKFCVITHVQHKLNSQGIFAYEPYVKEMNLWFKHVAEIKVVAPIFSAKILTIDAPYQCVYENNDSHSEHSEESVIQNENISNQAGNNKRNVISHSDTESARCNEKIPDQVGNDDASVIPCHDTESVSGDKKIADRLENNDFIHLVKVPAFNFTSLKNAITSIVKIPNILINIYRTMKWADHIHVRCPGNMGLLGCFVQVLFPSKPKTIKYAGNWDPNSQQPWSYKLQKWIVSNTFLTKNCKVLVYGTWNNQSKNILPFFTASYSEDEIEEVELRSIRHFAPDADSASCNEKIPDQVGNDKGSVIPHSDAESHVVNVQISNQAGDDEIINFIFVGGLTSGKQPLASVKIVHQLLKKGYQVKLDIYGEGIERANIETYIKKHQLNKRVIIHGNQPKEIIKRAYQKAHFLLFLSKSEGWPKVVAEAMFWGCVPITSNVSCLPFMLNEGKRGSIIGNTVDEGVVAIEHYLNGKIEYGEKGRKAMEWSRRYTLERFEKEIKELLTSFPT